MLPGCLLGFVPYAVNRVRYIFACTVAQPYGFHDVQATAAVGK